MSGRNHSFVDELDASRTPGERLEEDAADLPQSPERQPKERRPAA